MEKVLRPAERVRSALRSFVLEMSPWTMLPGRVDINWAQSAAHHVGVRRHTQNTQINEVIGDSEKCLLFYWKI